MNLYTMLTFVVYPVLFIGITMFLFFTCHGGKDTILQIEKNSIVKGEVYFEGDTIMDTSLVDSIHSLKSDLFAVEAYE
ncbi:hypothetical protein JGH11_02470 [Dysgonomonas sp. Marseille-P4677]|uniref:hypothetical protein n=1 Tax=Dysgonomonas sp. Marseille-P4677 TaxID=2364790 RepID=UPI001A5FF977|nr:hypothetical protein [Dysgonomonas sp. Marseille-P4677]MBK5719731.1 hypothetical protein [Dysgonomonas sp. Marseille-P4677]